VGRRPWTALAALAAASALAGCGGGEGEPSSELPDAATSTEITDLENVLELRAAFNDDSGKPRLVLLLSPT
jgi:hypothetical protein